MVYHTKYQKERQGDSFEGIQLIVTMFATESLTRFVVRKMVSAVKEKHRNKTKQNTNK